MTVEQATKADEVPSDRAPQTQAPIPFDQVLRRLVDGQQKKPAPKPARPPKKL